MALLLLGALTLAACSRHPVLRGGTDITGVPWGQPFTLTDAAGHTFHSASLRGQVVLLYFGYLRCTDVCVPTLRRLAALRPRLEADGAPVTVVFVSLDPHDTSPRLARFIKPLGPGVVGLTGTPAAVARVARDFQVAVARQRAVPVKDRYLHSDGLYLLGPHGHPRLYAPATISLSDLRHDIRALL